MEKSGFRINSNTKSALNGLEELVIFYRGKEKHFPLRKIDEEELFNRRLSGKPGFVYKNAGNLFYAEIIPNVNISLDPTNPHEHKCGMCSRCSTLPDEAGGCQKVRNYSAEEFFRHTNRNPIANMSKKDDDYANKVWTVAKRIEKYPFVTEGYETFNMNMGLAILNISSCSNFIGFNRSRAQVK